MRAALHFILPFLFLSLAGCGSDDAPPPAGDDTATTTRPIRIERWLPNLVEPIVETIDAPTDEDTIVLADQYGAWTLTWNTSPAIAVYGQAPYWMRVRPLMDGGVVAITYTQPAPTAIQ